MEYHSETETIGSQNDMKASTVLCKGNQTKFMIQFSLVTQSCLTLCNPMDCSMPGFPVHHQVLEPAQLMSIESVMPSNHLILCCPLLVPSIFPSIRVFSSQFFSSGSQSIGASVSAFFFFFFDMESLPSNSYVTSKDPKQSKNDHIKEQSWKSHTFWFQNILESHNNQKRLQYWHKRQIQKPMEQKRDPRNKPSYIWLACFLKF